MRPIHCHYDKIEEGNKFNVFEIYALLFKTRPSFSNFGKNKLYANNKVKVIMYRVLQLQTVRYLLVPYIQYYRYSLARWLVLDRTAKSCSIFHPRQEKHSGWGERRVQLQRASPPCLHSTYSTGV